jgi:hypothetical protein
LTFFLTLPRGSEYRTLFFDGAEKQIFTYYGYMIHG